MELLPLTYAMVSLAGVLALAGSFLGALHPAGDALAVFRLHLGVAGLLWFAVGAALGLVSQWGMLVPLAVLASLVPAYFRAERAGATPVTLYQKNMSFEMADTRALAEDIRAVAPDFLTLQEVTLANAALLRSVSDILPHQHLCSYERVGDIAIASRWPFVPDSRRCLAHGMTAAQVDAPEGPIWLVSVHLHWPWPSKADQAAQHARILEGLAQLDGPVVLAGDFNMVRWSAVVRRTSRTIRAEPGGRARPSFPLMGVTVLPIDQVLVPRGRRGASETRPLVGSDHRGLLVRF